MGYCPFSSLGHDITDCIVTQQGSDTASRAQRHGQPARGRSRSTCARGLATGVCRDTIVCIVAGGRPCVATLCATRAAIRRPAPCDTTQERCDTARSTRGMGLCIAIQFCVTVRALRHGLRHGRKGATIRRPVRHDTAPSAQHARGLGAACAQLGP